MGKVTGAVFEDNLKAWSGDHCVDPRLVPGIFVSNRRFTAENPAIVDLAPTILKIFGLLPPEHMDGRAWAMQAAEHPDSTSARMAPVP
jgi:bisphosphoglycerate-independent phosphoglycerate mutase (AlkP superfamily)